MKDFSDPSLSILVLDFKKPEESKKCLLSIRENIKVPHSIIYYHNGDSDYAYQYYKDGLIDLFIQSRNNDGLGVGTRNLASISFSKFLMPIQNDQIVGRSLEAPEFGFLCSVLDSATEIDGKVCGSISLAGPTAGKDTYSERAHLIKNDFYRYMEFAIPLNCYGAGPYHHGPWREEQIQNYYKQNNYIHFTGHPALVIDNGVWSRRTNPDGSIVRIKTDTKEIHWESRPTEKYVFPDMTDEEWSVSLAGNWINGTIPEKYRAHSFRCWP